MQAQKLPLLREPCPSPSPASADGVTGQDGTRGPEGPSAQTGGRAGTGVPSSPGGTPMAGRPLRGDTCVQAGSSRLTACRADGRRPPSPHPRPRPAGQPEPCGGTGRGEPTGRAKHPPASLTWGTRDRKAKPDSEVQTGARWPERAGARPGRWAVSGLGEMESGREPSEPGPGGLSGQQVARAAGW